MSLVSVGVLQVLLSLSISSEKVCVGFLKAGPRTRKLHALSHPRRGLRLQAHGSPPLLEPDTRTLPPESSRREVLFWLFFLFGKHEDSVVPWGPKKRRLEMVAKIRTPQGPKVPRLVCCCVLSAQLSGGQAPIACRKLGDLQNGLKGSNTIV